MAILADKERLLSLLFSDCCFLSFFSWTSCWICCWKDLILSLLSNFFNCSSQSANLLSKSEIFKLCLANACWIVFLALVKTWAIVRLSFVSSSTGKFRSFRWNFLLLLGFYSVFLATLIIFWTFIKSDM